MGRDEGRVLKSMTQAGEGGGGMRGGPWGAIDGRSCLREAILMKRRAIDQLGRCRYMGVYLFICLVDSVVVVVVVVVKGGCRDVGCWR